MNLLRDGIQRAADVLDARAAETIIYRRGAEACELPATLGVTEWQLDSERGAESWQSMDFLVTAARLVFSTGLATPERGDKIEWLRGDTTRTYEVMSPENEDAYKESDAFGIRLRIHTKMTSDA